MSTFTFRTAARTDLADIIALLADDALGQRREDPSVPPNPRYVAAFDAIDVDPNQLLAVIEQDGRLAGCLQLSFIPGLSRRGMWRGQLESVRIAADCRDKGLGRAMIEWAIARCQDRGCELVQLTTDRSRRDALRFYESLGFEASHAGMKLAL